uniref:RNase H type-1 domain-containing protein n=1 Tax=Quercus lobata TaxID=97700 RepID=A0A7N2M429_QUELO
MDFLWDLLFTQHVGTEIIELTVTTAWCIWFDRNKTRLGAARLPPRDILVRARAILGEYQLAHQRPSKFKEDADIRWTPPNFPWYKTNVDAAVFPSLGMTGVGVIIRDHGGSVVAAMSKRMPLPLGPLEAEAKALDEANYVC